MIQEFFRYFLFLAGPTINNGSNFLVEFQICNRLNFFTRIQIEHTDLINVVLNILNYTSYNRAK